MPALAEALSRVPANHLVVDGEIIIPDSQGRSDHDALKEALAPAGSRIGSSSTASSTSCTSTASIYVRRY